MGKISVIGTGYVGLVTGVVFSHFGHNVICMDKDREKVEKLKKGIMPIYEPGLAEMTVKNMTEGRLTFTDDIKQAVTKSDYIFIAVDTMPKDDWQTDLTSVKAVAKSIGRYINGYKVVVTKSTVPVGTGDLVERIIKKNMEKKHKFDIVSNPEFLREGQAIYDTVHPDRVIIGTNNEESAMKVVKLYQEMNTVIKITRLRSAEIIKYASNSFLATKISFINSVADLAEETGADIEEIAEGIGLDKRIGREFLNAGLGYGGSCFPKDVASLVHTYRKFGLKFGVLEEVQNVNAARIDRFYSRIKRRIKLKGKKVAVWGLSFKPDTDDIREASSLKIIEKLLKDGAQVYANDPEAAENVKKIMKDRINYSDDMYECVKGADLLILITEWDKYKNADMKKTKKLMKGRLLFDGRNAYEKQIMENLGFEYFCIGK